MNQNIINEAIQLRHTLHQHPELSGQEKQTKEILINYLREKSNLEIVDKGSWFYAYYHAPKSKQCIAFRADFDAIAVLEENDWDYCSKNKGVAHKCGHDGHSAALVAFARTVEEQGSDSDVYFIFQHGEENGSGAKECVSLIKEKKIQEVYGVHNFPQHALGTLCLREKTICCASKGLELTFIGVSSHASEPERGNNPAQAISELVLSLEDLTREYEELVMATVIQIDVGEKAFGVSAHRGKLLLTIRAQQEKDLDHFEKKIQSLAEKLADRDGLTCSIDKYDEFPETYNHPTSITKIKKIARAHHFPVEIMEESLRTSEDFGYYLKEAKGALIWLGSGINCPPLHSEAFDYNDALIEKTVELFLALL